MGIFYAKKPGSADPELSWVRLAIAAVFLGALWFAAVYAGHDEKLGELYKASVHAFELLLGGAIGLLVGEGAGRKG